MLGLSSCGALLALDTSGGVAVRTTDYNPGYGYGSYRLGYDEARRQALFLSDKMAYELALNEAQFEAVYEINLDYLLNMRGERSIYGDYWVRRNSDMFYVLNPTQYNVFVNYDYFYRPVSWTNNYYSYNIYNYYDNSVYYYNQPVYYDSYRGGRNQLSNSYYAGRFGERTGSPIIINPSDNNYQAVAVTKTTEAEPLNEAVRLLVVRSEMYRITITDRATLALSLAATINVRSEVVKQPHHVA